MPYNFIEIEAKKNRIIFSLFLGMLFFYFLTAYLLLFVIQNTVMNYFYSGFPVHHTIFPSLDHTLLVLLIAFMLAVFHWAFSTNNLIEKISFLIGAVPIDLNDDYHRYLGNIISEVTIAMGSSRVIEPRVIPEVGMNAFAIEDFEGRAVIGVTEGLLSRLSRAQIEAVVGHEAGHIISGDCLATTVLVSLSEIYEESFSKVQAGIKASRGRGGLPIIGIYLVLGAMRFLSNLLRALISRQKEFRADAIAVRLTRQPLSLAEALKLISQGWRGSGAPGSKLESIFILNPNFSELDEANGFFPDLFSTHPPVRSRINALINMVHIDEQTLEASLKDFHRVPPFAQVEYRLNQRQTSEKWFALIETIWQGPFSLAELKDLKGFKPDSWVKSEGQDQITCAYDYPHIIEMFNDGIQQKSELLCPRCSVSLYPMHYEGAPIFKCSYCHGVFISDTSVVSRILIRQDKLFDDDLIKFAEKVVAVKEKNWNFKIPDSKAAWISKCPKCRNLMRRQFFVYSYPVEIDRCFSCPGTWFDQHELEVLQYIYENKDKFLYQGKSF